MSKSRWAGVKWLRSLRKNVTARSRIPSSHITHPDSTASTPHVCTQVASLTVKPPHRSLTRPRSKEIAPSSCEVTLLHCTSPKNESAPNRHNAATTPPLPSHLPNTTFHPPPHNPSTSLNTSHTRLNKTYNPPPSHRTSRFLHLLTKGAKIFCTSSRSFPCFFSVVPFQHLFGPVSQYGRQHAHSD